MATKKKAAPSRANGKKPPKIYMALHQGPPPAELRKVIEWFRFKCPPPHFRVIEILTDQITPATWWCHAHRGFLWCPTDRICWVNRDGRDHTIKFVGGRWPFQQAAPAGGIAVPAHGASPWYTLKREPLGASIRYDYYVDTPGPPDGPAIWSED